MDNLVTILVLTLLVNNTLADSCVGRCFSNLDTNYNCQCNTACERFGDCCADYIAVCLGGTCSNRCDVPASPDFPCQCVPDCDIYGDCCNDYSTVCTTSPLSAVISDIWNSDTNRFTSAELIIEPQGSRLFTYVNEGKFNLATFAGFISLLDNYERRIGLGELQLEHELAEVENYTNTLLATEAMVLAHTYLASQAKVGNSAAEFRAVIKELWFNLYSRSSSSNTDDSSGFEHVMVGEHSSSAVSGFHSWIQYYLEEKKGDLIYSSVKKTAEPDMIGVAFSWHGLSKTLGSFFVGTSPEIDLAIYTVCALMHPNALCKFTLEGNDVSIQTWDINHKPGPQIGSAYPAI